MANELNGGQMAAARCQVCDTPFTLPAEILSSMRVAGTFCMRCYKAFDMLTLRQWFKLDMAIQQLNVKA